MGNTYKEAGVDIAAGAALVEKIKPLARATARPGATGELGGFGGVFDLAAAGFRDPVLVAATDGVGTKLKLAASVGKHDTIGIDLVAMCVNDLVVQGAEPLFFLDYFATGKLEIDAAQAVMDGIAAGCREAGCALIGGETAELPGMYQRGEYDLAGFAVGAVERGGLLTREGHGTGDGVTEGDEILGLASAGVHSNGFSLVRRIVEQTGIELDAAAPFAPNQPLGEALLAPTRIYVRGALAGIRSGGVRALAHITGGGLVENIPRVLPDGLAVTLEATAWPIPPVFEWLASGGDIAPREMVRTFNCGVGMVVIVDPARADDIAAALEAAGEEVHRIGKVVPAAPDRERVVIEGWD